jgi:hypothetical protein
LPIDGGEVGSIAGMREQHRIPIRLEVSLVVAFAVGLVLIGIDEGRHARLLERGSDDPQAIGKKEVVAGAHRFARNEIAERHA